MAESTTATGAAPAHHPALAATLVRGHLENIEREVAHAAYVVSGAPAALPESAIRRLLLVNAVVGALLAELPSAPSV